MVKGLLYRPGANSPTAGGAELISVWRDDPESVLWVDLEAEPAEEETRILQEEFGIHPLAVQDAQRVRHPPKVEFFGEHAFLLFRGLCPDSETIDCRTIQLAAFSGERFLVTRHTERSRSAERLWAEVEADPSRMAGGGGALVLRLGRLLGDRYLKMLDGLEPRLEEIEAELLGKADDRLLAELVRYKGDLTRLRRTFHYHVQMVKELRSGSHPGFSRDVKHEVTDLYEQLERVASRAELYYGLASDLIEGYLSLAAHRLNQIMKVLTIVTVIFVPITFLAGIYGMNFENMPELKFRAGYFVVLGVMLLVVVALLFALRRKRWL